MKSRIVVIGKNGRLGAAICRDLAPSFEVVALGREEVDLAQPILAQLSGLKFDVLINASAATNVDWCENNPVEADRLNGTAVAELGGLASGQGARVIHISTDYVFDGRLDRPYCEADPAHPISVYGSSKRKGEIALLEDSEKHLTIRVSWLFGFDKPSFVDAILDRARNDAFPQAIADKFSAPTFTSDFVSWLRPLLTENSAGGLLHLCNRGGCSWQEFGQLALDESAKQGISFRAREIQPISLSLMKNFVAKRPPYTVMDTGRFTEISGMRPRPWEEAVSEYVRQKFRGLR
jgi:dTDP-4-dehydrorhamnose reductase